MGPGRPQDLLLETSLAAVGTEDPVAHRTGTGRGIGRDLAFGERDALGREVPGLGAGEEELDPGGAGLGGPLGELVGVLPGGEDERDLFLRDVGLVDPHLIGARGSGGACGGGLGLGRGG